LWQVQGHKHLVSDRLDEESAGGRMDALASCPFANRDENGAARKALPYSAWPE
jgi:hypothetical protein